MLFVLDYKALKVALGMCFSMGRQDIYSFKIINKSVFIYNKVFFSSPGAELQLLLKFNEHYHSAPPSVNFTTIPFHPNGEDIVPLIIIDQEHNDNTILYSSCASRMCPLPTQVVASMLYCRGRLGQDQQQLVQTFLI